MGFFHGELRHDGDMLYFASNRPQIFLQLPDNL